MYMLITLMPTFHRIYRATSAPIKQFPFSQQDGINYILNLLEKYLQYNELFRESFKDILSEKMDLKLNCTEKIQKIPFSIQDMIKAIHDALQSIEKYSTKIPFPKGNKYVSHKTELPIINNNGISLNCQSLAFSLDTIARNIAFWHKDGVWQNACTFVWIAEDPVGVGSGTKISTLCDPPKGYYNNDDNIKTDYTLETEMLYYINLSYPDGFLHSLAPLDKLLQLRSRVIITMDIMETHTTPQTYDWKKWEKVTDPHGHIITNERWYSLPEDKVIYLQNKEIVDHFKAYKEQNGDNNNKYTIQWTEELQNWLNLLDNRREYMIGVMEDEDMMYYKPEKSKTDELDKVKNLQKIFPEMKPDGLHQTVRDGDKGMNCLLLDDLKKREKEKS